jgi:hypothetical protein
MAERLDDDELKALLSQEIQASVTYNNTELSGKRTRALEYYQGIMTDTPAAAGRSSIVSSDTADTIGKVLPGIVRVFTASDRMAEYEPVGKGDDKFAKEATDYCNYIFWKDNPGYRILWDATHDSLLQGNGVVKHWWDESEDCEYSEHSGMTAEQIAILTQDGGEVVEAEADEPQMVPQQVMGPDGQPQMIEQPVETFKVKLKRVNRSGTVKIECIEPEDFLLDEDATCIEDARFCAHRDEKTRSDLIEMGFKKDVIDNLPAYSRTGMQDEDTARDARYTIGYTGSDAMQPIEIYECYIKVDVNGDGIAETVQAYYAGAGGAGELLDWEVWDDDVPFSDIPCEPVPHRWDARSIADETMDMQRVKTVLTRQMLDNLYWVNNPMTEVELDTVENPEMLATPVFGGTVWRKKGSMATAGMKPVVIPFIGDKALMGLEHFDQVIEARTGISRSTKALDPETLQNQTATASQIAQDISHSQVELIARNQAELGWKRVFKMILRIVVKHQDRPRIIRLKDEPVEMDPRFWNSGMDVTINVGLGTGSRDRDMAMLNNILNTQTAITMQLAQTGFPAEALDMLPKVIKTATKLAESSGIKNPDEYYPDINEEQLAQMKQQAMQPKTDPKIELEKAKLQMQMQLEQSKAQAAVEKERAQMLADLEVKKAEMEAEMLQEQQKLQFEREKLAIEAAQKEKDREQQWNIELLKINAQAQAKQQELSAQREMHGEKLAHEEKTKKRDGKNKKDEMLIAAGKNPTPDGLEGSEISKLIDVLTKALSAPKRVVRGPDGRATHVETMQ